MTKSCEEEIKQDEGFECDDTLFSTSVHVGKREETRRDTTSFNGASEGSKSEICQRITKTVKE